MIKQYIKDFGKYLPVVVATYNRMPYLQKTIWSLVASSMRSGLQLKIYVFDDKSTDGSEKWLDIMDKRGIIRVIRQREKLGTANAYNTLSSHLEEKDKWFVITNDDMWYIEGWIQRAIKAIYKFNDCGIVNLYNYTALNKKGNSVKVDSEHLKVITTGLGSCLMNRELFLKCGGFYLPPMKYMGFFATNFCKLAYKSTLKRNRMYQLIPSVSVNMDMSACPLNEILPQYMTFRKSNKM